VRQQELWCCEAGRPEVTGKVTKVTRMGSTGMKRCEGDYLALERITKGLGTEHTGKFREVALQMYGREKMWEMTCSWP